MAESLDFGIGFSLMYLTGLKNPIDTPKSPLKRGIGGSALYFIRRPSAVKEWEAEIEAGNLIVLMSDECHLFWGDLLGYVWGRTDRRTEISLKNKKNKQIMAH
ncbi:MAG: hypothetical protein D6756_06770 [Cyanobacteria bacterium J083]|nr:MAG: hypothetical protein D6756_06770 [Cyanobacteria bacterium J083]